MTVRPVKIPHPDGTYRYIAVDEEIIRALAFGAIRRAVAEARWYDRRARALADEIAKAGHNPYATTAMAVRLAIRAAIGSDKA